MPRPLTEWKVLPHSPIAEVDDGVFTVTGRIKMPFARLPRRMTVVRLRDARLVVYSAIALDESAMALLETRGRPAFLIVPSGLHRLDARVWKDRYPGLQVIAPRGARETVEKVVPVDAVDADFLDAGVQFVTVPGVQEREAALVVRRAGGTTIVVNDVIGNIRNAHGFGGWILRKAGFAGPIPQVPRVVRSKIVQDPAALASQFLRWSEIESLRRILVSHGELIERDPRQVLRTLAASLDERPAPAEAVIPAKAGTQPKAARH